MPGHVSLYEPESKSLFTGDTLFRDSIRRTDLPGGDYSWIMRSILDNLLPLGDEVRVYPGDVYKRQPSALSSGWRRAGRPKARRLSGSNAYRKSYSCLLYTSCLQRLAQAGYAQYWQEQVRPCLNNAIEQYRIAPEQLGAIHQEITRCV